MTFHVSHFKKIPFCKFLLYSSAVGRPKTKTTPWLPFLTSCFPVSIGNVHAPTCERKREDIHPELVYVWLHAALFTDQKLMVTVFNGTMMILWPSPHFNHTVSAM